VTVVHRRQSIRQSAIRIAGLWSICGALLCFAGYESAVHPAAEGPLPFNNWTLLLMGATLLALPTLRDHGIYTGAMDNGESSLLC